MNPPDTLYQKAFVQYTHNRLKTISTLQALFGSVIIYSCLRCSLAYFVYVLDMYRQYISDAVWLHVDGYQFHSNGTVTTSCSMAGQVINDMADITTSRLLQYTDLENI